MGAASFPAGGVKGFELCKMDEQALIKLYVELTGMPEAAGRDVFMMLCKQDGQDPTTAGLTNSSSDEIGEPGGGLPHQDLSAIRTARTSAAVPAALRAAHPCHPLAGDEIIRGVHDPIGPR